LRWFCPSGSDVRKSLSRKDVWRQHRSPRLRRDRRHQGQPGERLPQHRLLRRHPRVRGPRRVEVPQQRRHRLRRPGLPAGRLDGVVSSATDAENNLPGSTFDVAKLISNFAAKGFTPEELVILSGAHSIGRAHCSSFRDRLSAPSGEINPYFRDNVLAKDCGAGPADPTVENNIRDQNATALGSLTSYVVPASGGASLDNSYYINNLNNLVLFHSDWAIVGSNATRRHVHEYADNGKLWNLDFADALVKLSKLAMPPGSTGEIRKTCRATNY